MNMRWRQFFEDTKNLLLADTKLSELRSEKKPKPSEILQKTGFPTEELPADYCCSLCLAFRNNLVCIPTTKNTGYDASCLEKYWRKEGKLDPITMEECEYYRPATEIEEKLQEFVKMIVSFYSRKIFISSLLNQIQQFNFLVTQSNLSLDDTENRLTSSQITDFLQENIDEQRKELINLLIQLQSNLEKLIAETVNPAGEYNALPIETKNFLLPPYRKLLANTQNELDFLLVDTSVPNVHQHLKRQESIAKFITLGFSKLRSEKEIPETKEMNLFDEPRLG